MFLAAATELLGFPGLLVIEVNLTPDHITITTTPDTPSAACPLCQGPSHRVHSTYARKVADLPWGWRTITLWLQVRRFFCGPNAFTTRWKPWRLNWAAKSGRAWRRGSGMATLLLTRCYASFGEPTHRPHPPHAV
jgi:transposase